MWCDVVWFGVVWCDVWCDLVWYGVVWLGVMWFGVMCGVVWCGVVWWHRAEGSALLHFLLSLETRSRAPHCQFPPSPDTGCHGGSSALEGVETNTHDVDIQLTETSLHPTMYQHMHMHPSANIVREHSPVHLAHQVVSVSPILS